MEPAQFLTVHSTQERGAERKAVSFPSFWFRQHSHFFGRGRNFVGKSKRHGNLKALHHVRVGACPGTVARQIVVRPHASSDATHADQDAAINPVVHEPVSVVCGRVRPAQTRVPSIARDNQNDRWWATTTSDRRRAASSRL